jgi:CO dehydrogenase/acetyl-CoA synthase beta subunit|tara:strand:+ start:87 stop:323 length:237 start_codon:yes stop_codon:yes gene_type:complete
MSKAPQEALENLHSQVARELSDRIATGEASSADISNAIKFLKDNGIEGLPVQDSPLGNLAEILPFPKKEKLKKVLADC